MQRRTVIATLFGVLLLAGCSSSPDGPAPSTPPVAPPTTEAAPVPLIIKGSVALPFVAYVALEIPNGDSACGSAGPDFHAIQPGVQVQAKDSAGTIVGTGTLGNGEIVQGAEGQGPVGCRWAYEIPAETGGKYYTVKVLDWETDAVAEERLATETVNVLPYEMAN